MRHLDVRSLWVQWACKTHGLKIVKIPGESNPADIGTKSHTGILLRKLRDMCGLVPKSTLPRVACRSLSDLAAPAVELA